jgi:hypothetical protein
MQFYYTSYWTSTDGETFTLCGVIAANHQAMGAYFPDEPSEQARWDELACRWTGVRDGAATESFLRELSGRGNGINEEYDEVREIEAVNLRQALKKAYQKTQRRHSPVIQLYQEIPVGDVRLV